MATSISGVNPLLTSTWAQESSIGAGGKVDFMGNPPLFLSMPDNHYHLLGSVVGDAFDLKNRQL